MPIVARVHLRTYIYIRINIGAKLELGILTRVRTCCSDWEYDRALPIHLSNGHTDYCYDSRVPGTVYNFTVPSESARRIRCAAALSLLIGTYNTIPTNKAIYPGIGKLREHGDIRQQIDRANIFSALKFDFTLADIGIIVSGDPPCTVGENALLCYSDDVMILF